MHKIRKNSLSPCYSSNTKQNLMIENVCSPIGISFKNLQQVRKKKTIQNGGFMQEQKIYQNHYFSKHNTTPQNQQMNHKTSTNQNSHQKNMEKAGRQNQKSIDDYRSSLKSKDKQMTSLHSQVSTLNSTVALLKEQVSNLKQENSVLCEQNTSYKKVIKQKNEIIQRLKKQKLENYQNQSAGPNPKTQVPQQCQKCLQNSTKQKTRSDQYEQVIQKLNELEMEQNNLFKENQALKKKQSMNKAMYRNIRILLDGNRIQQIKELLTVLIQ